MASDSYRPLSPDLSLSTNTAPSLGYRPQSPDLSAIPSAHDSPLQSRQFSQYTSYPQYQPFSAQPQYMAPQVKQEDKIMQEVKSPVDPTMGVVLKTSFPVARIKRIMQADEDIGKVAQVTPHVVSRALELFMIKLITSSADQARGNAPSKGPRRVLAQHMKRAIQNDETFDFLAEIISKIPDAPAKGAAKKEAGSDSEDAKPRKRMKKRKGSTDDV